LIISKKLKKFTNIKHGFFNRNGGTSSGIYRSLNCGAGSLDSKKNVFKNLKIVSKKIGCLKKRIVLLHQIHSNKYSFIGSNYKFNKKKIKGDALITNMKKVALGVLTADCVPVLIYDKKLKFISAIHVGWKGAYNGIVDKVIKFFIKKGSQKKNLLAVVGPSITEKNYEVQKDFKDRFLKKDKKSNIFFKTRKNKTYFSLNSYVYNQLERKGITNLELINKDTFEQKNNFFSARRSIYKKQVDYGRNISIIMIK
tara:strand:- start:117 stop:878 length:762 start_codon:yes stop_codon:yes gene_type:complete